MKKLFILLIALFICVTTNAQNSEKVIAYCMVESVPTNLIGLGSKCQIQVDFGQGSDNWRGGNDNFIVNEKGEVVKFNSIVHALNYMVARGWEVVNESVLVGNNQKTYHWLMKKEVSSSDQIYEGILLKGYF